jgi:site-specific recombinase XerD
MRRYLDKLGDVPGDTLLFPFKSRWGLAQMVRRARKRAGLPYYRPHAIGRHAFATRLLSGGASLLDVQKAGGWKSARMVSDVYAHLAKEHVDGIVGAQELRPPKTKKRKKEDDAA